MEISCNPGQSLVFFLEPTGTKLAPRPEILANNSTTNDRQSGNNVDSGVESTWIPLGISSAEAQKWTIQYYIDHILPEVCALRDARDRRKLVVHADNATPHVAKRVKQYLEDNSLKSAPHPPYSPELAPSDFFSSAT
jgi:hypothetical protein